VFDTLTKACHSLAMAKNYIGYVRVSTSKQGIDGYGIAAQKEAIMRYIQSLVGAVLLFIFEEVETGKVNNRPQLLAAIERCKREKATLVIGKLDRLSRNAAFLLSLRDSNLDFVCCDMPSADRFTIGIMALLAEKEREMISQRTKLALKQVKASGKALGNPNAPEAWKIAARAIQERKTTFAIRAYESINEIQSTGVTALPKIAHFLNLRGERTRRGGQWTTTAVSRVLKICKNPSYLAPQCSTLQT
jgi:DNA invertase Pin-like site-specific DNA recombinase